MIQLADLPDVIPIFPLPGAVLLPRAKLPLHVFEPRYLQMLEDSLKTSHRLVGMIQPHENKLHRVGCAGRVTQFSETDDGRYMITLTGVSRFVFANEVEGFTPYRRAHVDWQSFEGDAHPEMCHFDRPHIMGLLARLFEARGLSTDWGGLQEAEDEMLINSLSMMLDFSPEDKQALVEAQDLTTRVQVLTALIEFSLCSGAKDDTIQ